MPASRSLPRLPVLISLPCALFVLALLSANIRGADSGPDSQKAPAARPHAEEDKGLPDISYEKALSLKSVDKLETLQDVYESEINNKERMSELLTRQADHYRSRPSLGMFGLERALLTRSIRTLSPDEPDLEKLSDADLIRRLCEIYSEKSRQYTANVVRYRVSLTNINRAIVALVLEDAGAR